MGLPEPGLKGSERLDGWNAAPWVGRFEIWCLGLCRRENYRGKAAKPTRAEQSVRAMVEVTRWQCAGLTVREDRENCRPEGGVPSGLESHLEGDGPRGCPAGGALVRSGQGVS